MYNTTYVLKSRVPQQNAPMICFIYFFFNKVNKSNKHEKDGGDKPLRI